MRRRRASSKAKLVAKSTVRSSLLPRLASESGGGENQIYASYIATGFDEIHSLASKTTPEKFSERSESFQTSGYLCI